MDTIQRYSFARGENESIFVTVREYKQKKYIDLRIFFRPKDQEEMIPTKKGITIGYEYLADLKKALSMCESDQETSSVKSNK